MRRETSGGAGRYSTTAKMVVDFRGARAVASEKRKKWYNFRRPRGVGPFFILLLNLLVSSYQLNAVYNLLNLISDTSALNRADPWVSGFLSALLSDFLPKLLYPFAGWLADAKFGRYRVMLGGMWIMWVAAVLLLTISIIRLYVLDPDVVSNTVYIDHVAKAVLPVVVILYIISAVGTAGFHVNLIPFGIDQMDDCSSEEISSFVHWYYWTRNVNFGVIVQFAISAAPFYCEATSEKTRDVYDLLISLIQVTFLTVAISLVFLFSTKLNKDPMIHNPIKKVKVISAFILKHNQPVGYRSAYTYTTDAPPVRSDFAKQSYGGYFEDDDVEEVTAFWRIVVFLAPIGVGAFLVMTGSYNYSSFFEHMAITKGIRCVDKYIVSNMVYTMTYAICIPVFEFLIYPFFRKYVPRITVRIGLGMVAMVFGYCLLLATDVMGHMDANINSNLSDSVCIFYESKSHITYSPFTLVPIIVIVTIGELLVFIATLEFISAQSPHSMRGLIIGIIFFIYGVAACPMALLMMTFALGFKNHPSNSVMSCGSSYILAVIGIGVVGFVLYLITAKWYKKRQRGGQSNINYQSVLEGYYERRIRSRNSATTSNI